MIGILLFLCFAAYCVYEIIDATPGDSSYIDCTEQKATAKELNRLLMLRRKGE